MDKCCSRCKIVKDIYEFYRSNRYKDGHVTWCKSCKLAHSRENPHINKTWVLENPSRVSAIKQKYVDSNRDKVRASKQRWSKANKAKELAKVRKYQASKILATPKWLTKEQLNEMVNIYVNCPEGYQVDHIVPLRGKNIRGLHVPWNLQYLTEENNKKKSNKY